MYGAWPGYSELTITSSAVGTSEIGKPPRVSNDSLRNFTGIPRSDERVDAYNRYVVTISSMYHRHSNSTWVVLHAQHHPGREHVHEQLHYLQQLSRQLLQHQSAMFCLPLVD